MINEEKAKAYANLKDLKDIFDAPFPAAEVQISLRAKHVRLGLEINPGLSERYQYWTDFQLYDDAGDDVGQIGLVILLALEADGVLNSDSRVKIVDLDSQGVN